MRYWKQSLRALRFVGIAILTLVLLAFALVQVPQRLFRHRAERLVSDFHSIRLHQSTWADAQRLMTRWGAWGGYQGACTEQNCVYNIRLEDPGLALFNRLTSDRMRTILFRCIPAYLWLGGKAGKLQVSFLVQDGFIVRDSIGYLVENRDDSLMLSARASQSLRRFERHGPWILGDYGQLARHPNYIEGRPGGCEGCMSGEVTFTPRATPSEIRMFTSYNLDCLAPYHSCRTLPDMLAAAKDWQLYPSEEGAAEPRAPAGPPQPCRIPLFALGRDFQNIFVVDVLSVAHKKDPAVISGEAQQDRDVAQVRLVTVLKGKFSWSTDALTQAVPYAYDSQFPDEAAEHLEAGKRYVLLPRETTSPKPMLAMDRCGTFLDSAAVESEIKRGMLQGDPLRYQEKFGSLSWFAP